MDDFFAKAHELVQAGVPFVTAIVVRAEKPTSGKPGDKAIITVDGVMHGWIGGSCAQPTVIRESLNALAADEARFIRLSTEPEAQQARPGLLDLPMTCYSGGSLEIFLEPQPPRPRLLIVGTLPVARALAHLGRAMNFHIVAVDLDGSDEEMPSADQTLHSLDHIAHHITPYTYVVVATHGNYDELALEKILAAHPPYVGLVASPKRAAGVREYLSGQGLSESDLLPLKAPAGLDIQARRGDEIALSIIAEIVQRRRNTELINLALFQKQTAAEPVAAAEPIELPVAPGKPGVAIDPICGMEVQIATARHTYDHEGTTYYFCCPGCRQQFIHQTEQAETAAPEGKPAIAIDPICGMEVQIATARHTYKHEGTTYYFCCPGCRQHFIHQLESHESHATS